MRGSNKEDEMPNIVRAEAEDYEQLVAIGNLCFRGQRGSLERRWCHVWGGHLDEPAEEYLRNFFLYKQDSRIWGMVGVIPMRLEWGGEIVRVGGISPVATHPEYRGRGVMTKLLAHADAVMQERGDELSVLGGDRKRYGRFGWEHIGRMARLLFSKRYWSDIPDLRNRPNCITADSDDRVLEEVLRLYNAVTPRFVRSLGQLRVLLSRPGAEIWAVEGGSGLESYLAAFDNRICEYRGDSVTLPGLIKYFASMHDYPEVVAHAPPDFGVVEERLLGWSSDMRVGPLFSLKILRLAELLRKLVPAMRKRLGGRAELRLEVALTVEESGETVALTAAGGDVEIVPGDVGGSGAGRVSLNLVRRQMARLLFGPFTEGVLAGAKVNPGAAGAILRLFPLPLHGSRLDLV